MYKTLPPIRMKYLFIFLMISTIFLSCKQEAPPISTLSERYWGEASAQQNGQFWKANPVCWVDRVDDFTLVVQLDSFYSGVSGYSLRESLTMAKIPPAPGEYTVHKYQQYATKTRASLGIWDDDQPLGDYEIVEADSATNKVTILSYDTLSKEIKGTFNLTFKVTKRPYPDYPDTIRYTNGVFHGKKTPK